MATLNFALQNKTTSNTVYAYVTVLPSSTYVLPTTLLPGPTFEESTLIQ